jgi:hypothetical protein
MHVQHACVSSCDDQRAGINADHFLPSASIQRDDAPARVTRFSGGGLTGGALPDDGDIAMQIARGDRRAGLLPPRQRRRPSRRMTLDLQAGARFDLTRAHIRHAIHRRQAVRTISGKTQTAAALNTPAQHGDEHAVASGEFKRSAVNDYF